jgi:hypothetical protein
MNLAALALMAATSGVGQPVAPAAPPEVRFVAKRTLTVPVEWNPNTMQEVVKLRLFVSRDRGNTYSLVQAIDQRESEFKLDLKEDGEVWLQMQEQRRDGTLLPKDPSAVAPSDRVVIDATLPAVIVTAAERVGDEVAVEWKIDDKHPADATTKVFYKPLKGDDSLWKEAPAGSVRRRAARFKPDVPGPLLVQVATADLAGNVGAANREVSVRSPGGVTTVSATGPAPGGPLPPPAPVGGADAPAPSGVFGGPAASAPLPPADPPAAVPPLAATAPTTPGFTQGVSFPPSPTAPDAPKPIAVGSGTGPAVAPSPAAAPPAPESLTTNHVRTPRFDLNYSLDGGPSGVARVDLYVTRDDGRNWVRWSQHDGRESPLKVALDQRFNKEVEGDYGIALVPVSGAGLSDGAPTAGTAPELRVRVDTTAPVIKVYQPTADPANRTALVLHWEATDRNFGKEPLAIEFSETPAGPWRAVNGGDGAGGGKDPPRLENTGSYSWQPPVNLAGPKVYLRFQAWDAAGNRSEVITPNPILVDLTKPKARIQGIALSGGR